jgi:RNA polymerase sigma-70 factor (ECF subfamily)
MNDRKQQQDKSASPGNAGAASSELAAGEFRTGLYRYLLRRLRSAQDAEDLVQEVYLRLLRVVDSRQIRFPQAYLYRIAFNVLCEFQVRARDSEVTFNSETADQVAEYWADETALPEEAMEETLREERLERTIAELPPMQRAVLRLAAKQNLSHAQIAEALGISVSTMRNHLYKAIASCRRRFEDDASRESP